MKKSRRFTNVVCTVVCLFFFSGCPADETTPCGDKVCQKGFTCDEIHEICVVPSQLSVCVGLPDGAPCYVAGQAGYLCHLEVCIVSYCGDGLLDRTAGEECDDATANSDDAADACRTDCQWARCGDGAIDSDEQCDDGEANSDAIVGACRTNCTLAECGNGLIEIGEECDDGGGNADDVPNACRTSCRLPNCGDGVKDYGEECDDGNVDEQDDCLNSCQRNVCGDAIVNLASEECDDGNLGSSDGCSPDCRIEEVVLHGFETYRALVADDGSFAVVYHTGSGNSSGDLKLQRYDATGGLAGPPQTITTDIQYLYDAAMNGTGDVVVCWRGVADGLLCQIVQSVGVWPGTPIAVSSTWNSPRVAIAADGALSVAWTEIGTSAVWMQLFDPTGAPLFSPVAVASSTNYMFGIAINANHNTAVHWGESVPGPAERLYLQRFNSTGALMGSEFASNDFPQHRGEVAMTSDGRIALFRAYSGGAGSMHFLIDRFLADGTHAGEQFVFIGSGPSYLGCWHNCPWAALDDQGNAVVARVDHTLVGGYTQGPGRIQFARYDFDGVTLHGWTQANGVESYNGLSVLSGRVASSPSGYHLISWGNAANVSSFAKRYDPNGLALPWP